MMDSRHALFPLVILALLAWAASVHRMIGDEEDWGRLTLGQFDKINRTTITLIAALFAGAALWAQR